MKKTQKTLSSIIILSLILSCFSSMFAFGAEPTDTTIQYTPSEAQMQEYINNSIANKLSDTANTDLKSAEVQNSIQDYGELTIVNQTYNSVTFSYPSPSYPCFAVLIGGKVGEPMQSYSDPNCTVDIEPFKDYEFYVLDFTDYIYNPETGEVTWYPTESNFVYVDGTPTISLTGSANDVSIEFNWTTSIEYPAEYVQYDLYINDQCVTSTTDSGWGTLMYQPDFDHVGYVEAYPVDFPNNKVTSDTCTVHSNNLPDPSPLTISANNITQNSVTLSWTCDNPDVYNMYYVYNQITGDGEPVWDQYDTISNLQPDTDYTFTVAGYYCGFLLDSEVITVHTAPLNKIYGYVDVPLAVGATVTINGSYVNTDNTGRFEFDAMPNGVYNLQIAAKSALTRTIQVTVAGADVVVSTTTNKIPLMFGDANHSGKIDISDQALIQGTYGATPSNPLYNINYDFDNSGVIDVSDLMTVKGNFNKTSASYPEWVI